MPGVTLRSVLAHVRSRGACRALHFCSTCKSARCTEIVISLERTAPRGEMIGPAARVGANGSPQESSACPPPALCEVSGWSLPGVGLRRPIHCPIHISIVAPRCSGMPWCQCVSVVTRPLNTLAELEELGRYRYPCLFFLWFSRGFFECELKNGR
jgi:hypothetical protein